MTLEHAQHPPPLCPGKPLGGTGRRGVLAPPASAGGARISGRVGARFFGTRIGTTTVRRMLRDSPKRPSHQASRITARIVTAKCPNHVWHVDLTTVPTSLGFWTAWLPLALPQRWPFCWWVAVAVDHYSRRAMGAVAFTGLPSSTQVQVFLDRVTRRAGVSAKHHHGS